MPIPSPEQTYRAFERLAAETRDPAAPHGERTDHDILTALRNAHLSDATGRAPNILIGTEANIALPDHVLASVRKLISPQGYRKEGILALPTDRPIAEREFADVKEYFALSYERHGVVDLDRVQRIFPDQKFYHATNGLSYALQRQVGWLSAEDVAYVAQEICRLDDYLEIDPGFFVGNDLEWVAGYALPWQDNRPSDLLKVLQIDTTDPAVRRLMNTGLLLEVDLEYFRRQLPSTDCFVVRQGDINRKNTVFEIIAPVAPMNAEIRAIIDFNHP